MKLILLDRDGVINQDSKHYIKSPDEWQAIPGSLEAIAQLNQQNFQVALATNQAGVGRGLFTLETLQAIHHKMQQQLADIGGHLDAIYFCPHHPDEQCRCRKPQPGMLLQAMADFAVTPKETLFLGDSLKDIQAAQAAGCHPALVLTGNGQATQQHPALENAAIYKDLSHFAHNLVHPPQN